MRFGTAIQFVIIIGLLLVGLLPACAGGDGSASLNIMKKIPVDSTTIDYWDIEKLNGDEDLWDIYEIFRGSSDVEGSQEALQLMGINVTLASIEQSAKASGFGISDLEQGSITVLSGNYDVDDIKRGLESKEYQKTSWQEVEIWTSQNEEDKSIALPQSIILMGDVESLHASIDTIVKDNKDSLYEDPNIRSIADELPEGVIINISKAGSGEKYDNLTASDDDLIACGKSYIKENKGNDEEPVKLKLTAIYMFQDDYAAGQAKSKIETYLGTKSYTDIKTERDKNFIQATALIYIDDFVNSLAY